MWKILLVDDEPKDHGILAMMLPPEFSLVSSYTGNEAISTFDREKPDMVLLDILLPDMSGIEVAKYLAGSAAPPPAIVMVSGMNETNLVVEAIKAGASDYVVKPYTSEGLLKVIRAQLVSRSSLCSPVPRASSDSWDLVGESPEMRKIKLQIFSYAESAGTVLITGESGTGKEVVARALHKSSNRGSGPFFAVNCGAVPETLFESEMFGSERGAFTGATTRPGFLESTHGGTLLLDEIGELSPALQVKLLRVLEEKQISPLGSLKKITVDVRIAAATNRDLKKAVDTGAFRADLYYRLNVFRIRIPPLRERREDIPLLSYAFLRKLTPEHRGERFFSTPALRKIMDYPWPGNVRELRNVIERAFHLCPGVMIGPEFIQFE
jgi:DNA-binding NtrC family response regulator